MQNRALVSTSSALILALVVGLFPSWALAQTKHVFVTSETTDGLITENVLTGVLAADAICARLAQASTALPANAKADPWKAWLSNGSLSPSTTFTQATVPYRLTDLTTVVATSYADLIDGTALSAAINRDENNNVVASSVWTGTVANGTRHISRCGGFISNNSGAAALIGDTTSAVNWTTGATATCDGLLPFYCFQQGAAGLPVTLQSFKVE